MRWRESYMRIVDMLLDSKNQRRLLTALELSIAGDDAAAVELIDAILGKRNAKNRRQAGSIKPIWGIFRSVPVF